MPRIYKKTCDNCYKPYRGFGKFYCSSKCQAPATSIRLTGRKLSDSVKKKISDKLMGRKMSLEAIINFIKARKGKPIKSKILKASMHQWIYSIKGYPKKCIDCGEIGKKVQRAIYKRWNIHWSNIDHKYSRNPDDYIGRCPRCHKKYDMSHGLTNC